MKPHDFNSGEGGAPSGLMAEINVTPFIDVMLVLLIIFMVAAPLMMAGVPLRLPGTSAAALPPAKEPLVVSMDREGKIFIGDEAVENAKLPEELAKVIGADPERAVYVRCDKTLDYGRIMDLLGRVGEGGVSAVSLVAEQKQEVAEPEGTAP